MATITVPKNFDGGWYYPNGGFPAKPGDVVEMEGNYAYINIKNLHGTAEAPIRFIQKPGAAKAWAGTNNGYAWVMMNSKFFSIEGIKIGAPDGKFVDLSLNLHGSDEFIVKDCEILNAKIGFFSNLNNRHYNNIRLVNNYIHDITDAAKSNFSEAVYFGPTDGTTREKASFRGLVITGNRFENIGGDGIQIANGIDIVVSHNTIKNYGFHNISNQRSGILFGGGTNGIAEGNALTGGTGCPFNILGTGEVIFKNNTATGCATAAGQDGFYIRQSFPTLKVRLIGNKIDKVARNWINDETKSIVENTGNQFGGTATPPVVVPPVDPHADCVPKAVHAVVVKELQDAKAYAIVYEARIAALGTELAAATLWRKQTTDFINRP